MKSISDACNITPVDADSIISQTWNTQKKQRETDILGLFFFFVGSFKVVGHSIVHSPNPIPMNHAQIDKVETGAVHEVGTFTVKAIKFYFPNSDQIT